MEVVVALLGGGVLGGMVSQAVEWLRTRRYQAFQIRQLDNLTTTQTIGSAEMLNRMAISLLEPLEAQVLRLQNHIEVQTLEIASLRELVEGLRNQIGEYLEPLIDALRNQIKEGGDVPVDLPNPFGG